MEVFPMTIHLNQLGQVALTVDDVDQAEHFFQELLGLRKLYRFGDLLFFDCAGVRLLVEKSTATPFQPASSILYFRTADLKLAYSELKQRGVSFIDARTWWHRWQTMICGWPFSKTRREIRWR
jgi:methylmalonyl-CoA/ethylmalonyl-CoA epimerase